ncbi:MAG TPA: nucleotidyl transferase AbiEii/AbiGii toxin family protein [Phycisphaerae bacterium]|nr:nucleotidyl transferase AbiEii/AbiGii toxin family protein [Phycisphaerae bacterium]
MSVAMIQDRLDGYGCRSTLEVEQALREITQEVVLASLGRTGFFQKAAFQGGTCLRVFHGTNRFSEDLDFALQGPDASFGLGPYLDTVADELKAYGYGLEMDDRSKADRAVRMAFLKDDSLGNLLRLDYRPTAGPRRKLRMKLEVDTSPPAGAAYEMKYLDFPFASAVCAFDLPSMLAGKMHALLCRPYVKGRDWYDFIWFTARGTPANYRLLSAALAQMGPWKDQSPSVDRDWCVEQLRARIEAVDWKHAAEEVRRFLKPGELPSLEIWGREFFLHQAEKLP